MENIDEYELFFATENPEVATKRKWGFIKKALQFIKRRRIANRLPRNDITRDRIGAHDRLVASFISANPRYDAKEFRKVFRMGRPLFNWIVSEVTHHSAYFRNNVDYTGKEGISSLLKCTSAIRQLAYDVVPGFLDEYLQMSVKTSRESLDHFCSSVMEIFGAEYMRKPTYTDVQKLYAHHEAKHGFPRMLGSLDCTDWEWFGCPTAFKGQYVRRDHGPNPFILLEAVVSQDLWIRHAFFGVSGSNNDTNVLYQSPLFNDLKTRRAPEVEFVANGVHYPWGYYLTDGIYPELAPLVKTISEPASSDHKRILYKQKQESARKDIERAFGVLKKKWAILANPARPLRKEIIMNMMYTCIILHNMVRKLKKTISHKWFPEEENQPDDMFQTQEHVLQVMWHISSAHEHHNLRADLVEHLYANA